MNVNRDQIWEFRPNSKIRWRAVRVMDISQDAVKLQFLDMPDAPDSVSTFKTTTCDMSDRCRYRFVSNRP
jgi:hypothetical protein